MREMKNLEDITAAAVAKLPKDEDFLPSHKRNGTAFTAFRLSFFKNLRELSRSKKRKYVQEHLTLNADPFFYDNANDSDDKVINVNEEYVGWFPEEKRKWNAQVLAACMRKAKSVYENYTPKVTRAWDRRVYQLNRIPVSGQFKEAPGELLGEFDTVYTDHLFSDTLYCFKQIRRATLTGCHEGKDREQKDQEQQITLARNDTGITIRTYIYIRELFVPSLLKLVLFGNRYNYIHEDRIVFQSASKLVVHIPSAKEIDELFTVENLGAVNFLGGSKSELQYIGCGKVTIQLEGGEADAYIVDSDDAKWMLHCQGDYELKMPALCRNNGNDGYNLLLQHTHEYKGKFFRVKQYFPIRLVIYKKVPKIKLMLHQMIKEARTNRTLVANIYKKPFTFKHFT